MARNLSGSPGPAACQEQALSAGFVALDVGGGQSWPAAHFAERWVWKHWVGGRW